MLYIEPCGPRAAIPVIDHLTRKMTAAFRMATPGKPWRGVHTCVCGMMSTNLDYVLPNGVQTNSLCVHYLAHHREEVPADELAAVAALTFGEEEPTVELDGSDEVAMRRFLEREAEKIQDPKLRAFLLQR